MIVDFEQKSFKFESSWFFFFCLNFSSVLPEKKCSVKICQRFKEIYNNLRQEILTLIDWFYLFTSGSYRGVYVNGVVEQKK